jgi:hypothetical protein
MISVECWELSRVSENTSVAIFGMNTAVAKTKEQEKNYQLFYVGMKLGARS